MEYGLVLSVTIKLQLTRNRILYQEIIFNKFFTQIKEFFLFKTNATIKPIFYS